MDLLWSVPRGLTTCWVLTTTKIKKDGRVNFFNKVSLGKDAFMRFDRPHPNTPFDYHHINIAKKYSGINDPHTQISERLFYIYWVLTSILRVLTAILAIGYVVYEVIENAEKDRNTRLILVGSWLGAMLGSYVGPQYGCQKWPGWGGITGGMIGGVVFSLLYRILVYFIIFFYENFIKANVLDP